MTRAPPVKRGRMPSRRRARGPAMLANAPKLRQDAHMDFAAAGLLDGLEGDERAAREQLLESLVEEGFSLEELQAAVAEDRLVGFASELVDPPRPVLEPGIEHRLGPACPQQLGAMRAQVRDRPDRDHRPVSRS